jgi:hypothetical protein
MDWKNGLAYWRGIVGPALGSHKINLRPVGSRLPSLLADCVARAGIGTLVAAEIGHANLTIAPKTRRMSVVFASGGRAGNFRWPSEAARAE